MRSLRLDPREGRGGSASRRSCSRSCGATRQWKMRCGEPVGSSSASPGTVALRPSEDTRHRPDGVFGAQRLDRADRRWRSSGPGMPSADELLYWIDDGEKGAYSAGQAFQ